MASWHRPWETPRDRSSFALGFSSALVTDVFVELSRPFLLALQRGLVQNPPPSSSLATIRPGDLYYLHRTLHSAHDVAIKCISSLGSRCQLVQRLMLGVNLFLLLLLLVVHLAFLSPHTKLSAASNLSGLIVEHGNWSQCQSHELLHLELLDSPWQWLEAETMPRYAISGSKTRTRLQKATMPLKTIKVSVWNEKYFGPVWARFLMSYFWLYDIYVVNALPQSCPVLVHLGQHSVLLPAKTPLKAWPMARKCLSTTMFLMLLVPVCLIFSSFLRSFLVLSVRMYVNCQFGLLQLRRFAFITSEMRKVNRAPPTILLEIGAAWGSMALILMRMLWEAAQVSVAWPFWIICYAGAEFWGLANVRSLQSRWIFPRCSLLLHAGTAGYAHAWPHGPRWLLVMLLLWSHATLCFTLLMNYDFCFSLQKPQQLMASSLLLPAVHLSREDSKEGPAEEKVADAS